MRTALAPIVALVLAVAVPGPPAAAQKPANEAPANAPAASAAPAADELARLVATLENEAERQKLLDQLRALIRAQRAAEPAASREKPSAGAVVASQIVEGIADRLDRLGRRMSQAVDELEALPATVAELARQLADPAVRNRWVEVAAKLLAVLAAGILAEWVVLRGLRQPYQAVDRLARNGWAPRLTGAVLSVLFDLLHVAAFALAGYGAMLLIDPRPATRIVALAVINASVVSRLAAALARAALAPQSAPIRPLPLGDETANYLFIWVRRLTVPVVYGFFAGGALAALGASPVVQELVLKLFGLVVALLLVVLILQSRGSVSSWLQGPAARGDADSARLHGLRRRLAELWHLFAVAYVLLLLGVWLLEVEGGFAFLIRAGLLTVLIVAGARGVQSGIDRLVARYFRIQADLRRQFPGLEQRANRYMTVVQRVLRVVVRVLAALLLLEAWGVQVVDWLASDLGRLVASHLARIILVFVGALAVWEGISALIERYLAGTDGDPGRRTRLRTLLPVLRNAVRVVLVVVVTLTVMAELGMNITPLLAGAGVVGLAVGFGAQSLVKDVITGIFILIEDSVAIGDVVQVAGHAGVVEGMTIRTVRLRDLEGNVHVVPFGQIATVLNMTKDFAFALIEAAVAYRENVDEVIAVLREVAEGLRTDPEFRRSILEPLEVLGIDSLRESAVNIQVRLKTRPMQQWAVKREFLRRMKAAFDARGIEIPFPHRTLYFGVDRGGNAPAGRVRLEGDSGTPGSAVASTPGRKS